MIAQCLDVEVTVTQGVVHRAVAATMLGYQAQLDQAAHRAIGAQQRLGQLEQCIGSSPQASEEVSTKPRQHLTGLDSFSILGHTSPRGLELVYSASTTLMITSRPSCCPDRSFECPKAACSEVKRQAQDMFAIRAVMMKSVDRFGSGSRRDQCVP